MQKRQIITQKLVLSNLMDPALAHATSISHLDYCKGLPTVPSSLKTVSFGGNFLKPRSAHVTPCLLPDSGPQHKL